jgi:hypothetical protein
MRRAACSFSASVCGPFCEKKKWNVASARHKPFSICQLPVCSPPLWYPEGITRKHWSTRLSLFFFFLKCNMRRAACSFSTSVCGPFCKKNKMECCLCRARTIFYMPHFLLFFSPCDTLRVSHRHWSRFLCSGKLAALLGFNLTTSIPHNNLNRDSLCYLWDLSKHNFPLHVGVGAFR